MVIIIAATLFVLGLIFGSFAGAQVWRLRARQLSDDKDSGEKVDNKEFKLLLPLLTNRGNHDRSRCLHCGHVLNAIDLFPLFSWISTGGHCRYCKKSIGTFEPIIELAVATAFVVSFIAWPQALDSAGAITQFIVWLVVIVLLAILFAYDAKWFLLPDKIIFPLIGISAIYAICIISQVHDIQAALVSAAGSVAILGGLYWLLWYVSHGKWVGFGDVKLGIALGLLLGEWQLAFLALFLANFIGTILVLPAIVAGRMGRATQIPFGPLFIAGFFISYLFGQAMIDWYLQAATELML